MGAFDRREGRTRRFCRGARRRGGGARPFGAFARPVGFFERASGGDFGRGRRFRRTFSRASEARLDFFARLGRRVGGVRFSFCARRQNFGGRQLSGPLRFLFVGTNFLFSDVVDFCFDRGVSRERSFVAFANGAADVGGAGGRAIFGRARLADGERDTLGNALFLRVDRDEVFRAV